MTTDKKIVMLGTRVDACGGIASVIGYYQADGLFERRNIVYLPTHCSGSSAEKIGLFAAAIRRLVWMLATGQVALVHVHVAINASFWRKYMFLIVAWLFRARTILHIHAGRFPDYYASECGPFARMLVRAAFDRVHAIVAVSAELNRWVRTVSRQAAVLTIHNPAAAVPGGEEAPPACAGRAAPALLFLGHIEHSKGSFDLIRAMPAVVSQCPQAKLQLCGDGALNEARALIRELALEDQVALPGWVDAATRARLLQEASVFVLPSHAEGLPMSVLEAMAAGLPVVATAVGGIPEAVTDGVEGLLVPSGDIAAISAALVRLLGDAAVRRRMGEAGRARARSDFSSARTVAAVEDLYDRLYPNSGAARPATQDSAGSQPAWPAPDATLPHRR